MKKSFLLFIIFLTIFNCKEKHIDDNKYKQLSPNDTDYYSFIEIKQIDKNMRTIQVPEFQEGNTKAALLNNARQYYTNYWHKYFGPDQTVPDNKDLANNPDQDIAIVLRQGDIGIVEHPGPEISYGEAIKREELWIYKYNYWQPIVDFHEPYNKIKIANLNADKYSDVIVYAKYSDIYIYNILLGGKNGMFKLVQEIIILGSARMAFNGACQRSSILAVPYSALKVEPRKLVFNCATNRFE